MQMEKINLEEKIKKAIYDFLRDPETYTGDEDLYVAFTDYFDAILLSKLKWDESTLNDITEDAEAEDEFFKVFIVFTKKIFEKIAELVGDNIQKILQEATRETENRIDRLTKLLEAIRKKVEG